NFASFVSLQRKCPPGMRAANWQYRKKYTSPAVPGPQSFVHIFFPYQTEINPARKKVGSNQTMPKRCIYKPFTRRGQDFFGAVAARKHNGLCGGERKEWIET
ncbi:hypothetical protein, partial [Angelakisella massiliensis]|uniref:hypothetical protein n=1 Tax=Angelakisella massiliensis TaxID=1871018 RepID=UPI0024B04E09